MKPEAIAVTPKAFDEVSASRPDVRQAILHELDRVCAGSMFAKSPGSVRLLRFLVEKDVAGAASVLRETYIGAALYGRDRDYDPKLDGIVRVNANRLRARLEEHYWRHPACGVELILRPGSYVPLYRFTAMEPEPPEDAPEVPPAYDSGPLPVPTPLVSPAAIADPPRRWWLWVAAALLLASCGAFLGFRARKDTSRSSRTGTESVWTSRPLTRFDGQQEFAAFSPDGKTVAFVWSGGSRVGQYIYLLKVDGGVPERLTAGGEEETRPAWSPDGGSIAYLRMVTESHKQVVVRNLRAKTDHIVAAIDGNNPWLCSIPKVSWSLDGETLFTSAVPAGPEGAPTDVCALIALDVATGARRQLTHPEPKVMGDLEAAVSPDGRRVAFMRNFSSLSSDLFSVPVEGGDELRLTADDQGIWGFSWDPGGKSLLVSSRRGDGLARLWRMPLAGGTPEQVTDGSVGPWFPATTTSGNEIAFTVFRSVTRIWRQSAGGREELVPYGTSNSKPQLSPDGRQVLYTAEHSGAAELWLSDGPGGPSRQLTHMGGYPAVGGAWSPDGRQIAFECRNRQHSAICLIAADGTGPVRRFTDSLANHVYASWSRDGKYLYYGANYTGAWEVYRQPVAGGPSQQITYRGGMRALESWDGRYLYVHRGEVGPGLLRLPTASFGHGALPEEQTVFLPVPAWPELEAWGVDKEGVLVLERQVGQEPRTLTVYPNGRKGRVVLYKVRGVPGYAGFTVAGDGSSICYATEERLAGELDLLERKPRP